MIFIATTSAPTKNRVLHPDRSAVFKEMHNYCGAMLQPTDCAHVYSNAIWDASMARYRLTIVLPTPCNIMAIGKQQRCLTSIHEEGRTNANQRVSE